MLVTSIFSFSHNVFKSLLVQGKIGGDCVVKGYMVKSYHISEIR